MKFLLGQLPKSLQNPGQSSGFAPASCVKYLGANFFPTFCPQAFNIHFTWGNAPPLFREFCEKPGFFPVFVVYFEQIPCRFRLVSTKKADPPVRFPCTAILHIYSFPVVNIHFSPPLSFEESLAKNFISRQGPLANARAVWILSARSRVSA